MTTVTVEGCWGRQLSVGDWVVTDDKKLGTVTGIQVEDNSGGLPTAVLLYDRFVRLKNRLIILPSREDEQALPSPSDGSLAARFDVTVVDRVDSVPGWCDIPVGSDGMVLLSDQVIRLVGVFCSVDDSGVAREWFVTSPDWSDYLVQVWPGDLLPVLSCRMVPLLDHEQGVGGRSRIARQMQVGDVVAVVSDTRDDGYCVQVGPVLYSSEDVGTVAARDMVTRDVFFVNTTRAGLVQSISVLGGVP